MASPESPDSREFRQMRHDVDDVFVLLTAVEKAVDGTSKTLGTVWGVQRRHGNRLEEIQQSLDLQTGRLDRMEDNQRHQGERLGRVEGRLDGVEGRLDGIDGRLEGVGGRLGRIEDTQQQILALLRGPAES
jgi:DNA-binding FrmR family transcriptional regulator